MHTYVKEKDRQPELATNVIQKINIQPPKISVILKTAPSFCDAAN